VRQAVKEDRIAIVQSLSGTGALRIAGEFIKMYSPAVVYCSDPTWGNHHTIFQKSGLETKKYRYLTPQMTLDFEGMVFPRPSAPLACHATRAGLTSWHAVKVEDLSAAPEGSVFVLHTVAHNPTGVDPTPEQWKKIADVCEERKAVLVFDTAYQGYASGDLAKDAWALRYFANERGMELMVTQSYSKNFGLYGERIGTPAPAVHLAAQCSISGDASYRRTGALNIAVKDKETAVKVQSQLKGIVRPMYSNPQLHGARLVAKVLGDGKLKALWEKELTEMANRIVDMRAVAPRPDHSRPCPCPCARARAPPRAHARATCGRWRCRLWCRHWPRSSAHRRAPRSLTTPISPRKSGCSPSRASRRTSVRYSLTSTMYTARLTAASPWRA